MHRVDYRTPRLSWALPAGCSLDCIISPASLLINWSKLGRSSPLAVPDSMSHQHSSFYSPTLSINTRSAPGPCVTLPHMPEGLLLCEGFPQSRYVISHSPDIMGAGLLRYRVVPLQTAVIPVCLPSPQHVCTRHRPSAALLDNQQKAAWMESDLHSFYSSESTLDYQEEEQRHCSTSIHILTRQQVSHLFWFFTHEVSVWDIYRSEVSLLKVKCSLPGQPDYIPLREHEALKGKSHLGYTLHTIKSLLTTLRAHSHMARSLCTELNHNCTTLPSPPLQLVLTAVTSCTYFIMSP